jgi:acyl dehydratase
MLPEEVMKLKGKTEVRIFDIEKGAIKKYAEAIEDTNPLYWDDEYARNSRYGSIIAPPGFWGWVPVNPAKEAEPFSSRGSQRFVIRDEALRALTKAGYSRVMDGGHAYEFFKPVRAGDTLAAVYKIVDIVERQGRAGKFIILMQETSYSNQHGELVGIWHQNLISRWRE